MKNKEKIILSAIILAVVATLMFLVIPITGTFIISYLFALVAIAGASLSLLTYGKGVTKAPQGHAIVYSAFVYGIVSIIFSVIANYFPLSTAWTFVAHAGILAVFVIRVIAITSGSEHINQFHEKVEEKHKEFGKEKESYWK